MARQAVLFYNCSGHKWTKLHQMMMLLRFRIRVVAPTQYHLTLEELALGTGEASEEAAAFDESMMVFYGTGDAQLQAVLNAINAAKLPPIPLKAVVTQTNKEWNSIQLHEELLKEKAAVEAKQ